MDEKEALDIMLGEAKATAQAVARAEAEEDLPEGKAKGKHKKKARKMKVAWDIIAALPGEDGLFPEAEPGDEEEAPDPDAEDDPVINPQIR